VLEIVFKIFVLFVNNSNNIFDINISKRSKNTKKVNLM
jgi:hypothetical protein